MVDFINEVEEELRKDDYNKLLKKYGPAIAAVIAIIIAGTAYLEWRKSSDDRMARAASSSYVSASDLAAGGQSDRAVSSFVALSEKAPSGYAGLSLMRAAAVELEGGDSAKAVDLYDQAAEKFKLARHKDLAKLKAAYILSDQGAYADVQARLDPLAAKEAPYEFLARELAGFVAYQTGDMNTARQEFTYLESIPGVPPSIAERAGQFLTLVPVAEAGDVAPEPAMPSSGDDLPDSDAALPPPNETEADALEPGEATSEITNQNESGDAP